MKNKSQRGWKETKQKHAGKIVIKKVDAKSAYDKRKEDRQKLLVVKKLQDEIKGEAARKKEQERKRLEAVKKQKEENKNRSVKIQEVVNPKKLARMSKKQVVKSRLYLQSQANKVGGRSDR